jgi:hypothetical protein
MLDRLKLVLVGIEVKKIDIAVRIEVVIIVLAIEAALEKNLAWVIHMKETEVDCCC